MKLDSKNNTFHIEADVNSDSNDENAEFLTLENVTPKLEKPWWRYGHLVQLNIFLLGGILAQVTSGYDGSMMNSLQSLPSWQQYFNHPSGSILSTMSNGIAIGTLITIPVAWWLCDYFGRRKTVILGCAVVILGAIIQGCAKNFGMFTGARILLGVGSCLSSAAASPLLAETAYPSQRAMVTALLVASWPLGSFTAALVTWGPYHSSMKTNNWSWRLPSLLQCFFPAIQLVIAFFGPESPRWLISKGHEDKALAIFVKYHAGGDESSKLVAYEMAEIKTIIEQERIQMKNKFAEWFKSKQRVRRFFIVCAVPAMAQLCGNALTSYYLPIVLKNIGISNPNDQLKINIGLTVYGLVWSVSVGSNVNRFPRRVMFIGGYILMCIAYVIWTALSAVNQQQNFENKGLGKGVVAMIFLFTGFYHIVSPVGSTYVMEVAPFHLRAQASTIYQLSGNIIGFFNNYVNNIAMVAITWRYYIVWCVWLVVQMNIVYWIFPETRGLGLEEVAQVFGEDVSAGYSAGDTALRYGLDVALKPSISHEESVDHDLSKQESPEVSTK
ncbi:general substrate transporter [Scheffersomyces xylosifermentans]|uniref:general substrate transporter n=1 Tax=Scheffersomyces xylosifermentans TaxID=1304137 RepID=UPI00315D0472